MNEKLRVLNIKVKYVGLQSVSKILEPYIQTTPGLMTRPLCSDISWINNSIYDIQPLYT